MKSRPHLSRITTPKPNSRTVPACVLLFCFTVLSGCSGAGLPPVFGAVFGLEGADVAPFTVGTVPDPSPSPGDNILGLAANFPGQCIYRRADNRRFRAACPDGYKL
ncbi:hypothetical protein GTW51_03180 [Aurantimonas aggregata]|uniref:Lipoprotein n=2 Tax=Aurantimonas aggregata TaxID=2047720 RepID=A0A6L9MDG0_9HYPH|nr:hypothetical protein [Aurantimonas aggregata]